MPVTVFLNTSTLIGAETHILDRVIVLPRTSNLPRWDLSWAHCPDRASVHVRIILHICQPMRTAEAVWGTEEAPSLGSHSTLVMPGIGSLDAVFCTPQYEARLQPRVRYSSFYVSVQH
jgi:hypothetical protein